MQTIENILEEMKDSIGKIDQLNFPDDSFTSLLSEIDFIASFLYDTFYSEHALHLKKYENEVRDNLYHASFENYLYFNKVKFDAIDILKEIERELINS
ncbi:MAG: hypothetical protein J0L69_06605 [Bacteroidetes bacterium]|nr:hypothetical protein [Bacteroidota bacterium]